MFVSNSVVSNNNKTKQNRPDFDKAGFEPLVIYCYTAYERSENAVSRTVKATHHYFHKSCQADSVVTENITIGRTRASPGQIKTRKEALSKEVPGVL